MPPPPVSLASLKAALAAGRVSSRALVEDCIGRIQAPEGEGQRVYVRLDLAGARARADAIDRRRQGGAAALPLAGIPISVKDLFDVAGQTTSAGSRVLAEQPPAAEDAPAIARLQAAGLILLGRTNMTEFAYSGLGLNPHHGTPLNPYDRASGRIPGGSSSGAAVSVSDGMALAGIGTDTGGSCRIPAALCGLVGFKPTARRIDRRGVYPLAFSLDSVGVLGHTPACCQALDALMAGETAAPEPAPDVRSLRLGVLRNLVLEDIEDAVANAFEQALVRLRQAGVTLIDVNLSLLNELPGMNAQGGMAAAEAWALHRARLARQADEYDPRVRARIEQGATHTAADYIDLLQFRRRLIAETNRQTADLDAVLYPTAPIVAPPLAGCDNDSEYSRLNVLLLRNTAIANFLDRCALSLPVHEPDAPPVGLHLMGPTMSDARLLAIGARLQPVLRRPSA